MKWRGNNRSNFRFRKYFLDDNDTFTILHNGSLKWSISGRVMSVSEFCLDVFDTKLKVLEFLRSNLALEDEEKKYYLFAGKKIVLKMVLEITPFLFQACSSHFSSN
jgi:hypothetical protein